MSPIELNIQWVSVRKRCSSVNGEWNFAYHKKIATYSSSISWVQVLPSSWHSFYEIFISFYSFQLPCLHCPSQKAKYVLNLKISFASVSRFEGMSFLMSHQKVRHFPNFDFRFVTEFHSTHPTEARKRQVSVIVRKYFHLKACTGLEFKWALTRVSSLCIQLFLPFQDIPSSFSFGAVESTRTEQGFLISFLIKLHSSSEKEGKAAEFGREENTFSVWLPVSRSGEYFSACKHYTIPSVLFRLLSPVEVNPNDKFY